MTMGCAILARVPGTRYEPVAGDAVVLESGERTEVGAGPRSLPSRLRASSRAMTASGRWLTRQVTDVFHEHPHAPDQPVVPGLRPADPAHLLAELVSTRGGSGQQAPRH
jgi:hypothetical protein